MIYLLRHGETEYNRSGRIQGALDSALTARGVQQAHRMGALLKGLLNGKPPARLVASPQGRAQHTARIVAQVLAVPVFETDVRLREVTLGSWDGLMRQEVDDVAPGWRDTPDWAFRSPDGDTYAAMSLRLAEWLGEARGAPGVQVAVSHGVASRVLRGLVTGMPKDEALGQPIPQDAIFRIGDGRVDRIDCEPVD